MYIHYRIVYIVKKGINIFFKKGGLTFKGGTMLPRVEQHVPPPLHKCSRIPLIHELDTGWIDC